MDIECRITEEGFKAKAEGWGLYYYYVARIRRRDELVYTIDSGSSLVKVPERP